MGSHNMKIILLVLLCLCLMPSLLYSASKKPKSSTKRTTKKGMKVCDPTCKIKQNGQCVPKPSMKEDPKCKEPENTDDDKKNSADSMISCLKRVEILLVGLGFIMTISVLYNQ